MTLLISILLIHGLGMSPLWYLAAVCVWALKQRVFYVVWKKESEDCVREILNGFLGVSSEREQSNMELNSNVRDIKDSISDSDREFRASQEQLHNLLADLRAKVTALNERVDDQYGELQSIRAAIDARG